MDYKIVAEQMDYERFCEEVKERIREFLPDRKIESVTLNTQVKNNGLKKVGIVVKEIGQNIAPTIYLEPYFERFSDGEEMASLLRDISDTYEAAAVDHLGFGNIAQDFLDFEKMKNKLVAQLVNTEYNEDLLERTPHKELMDLSLIYKVVLDNQPGGIATIRVENSHLRKWGVTIDELNEIAIKNTYRIFPPKVQTMNETLKEMMAKGEMSDDMIYLMLQGVPDDQTMWVISNESNMSGAFYMTDKEIMDKLAEIFHSDVVLLPSSIHECIAISAEMGPIEDLKAMVGEVNNTQVSREEQLSDNVYIYNAEARQLQTEEEYTQSKNAAYANSR